MKYAAKKIRVMLVKEAPGFYKGKKPITNAQCVIEAVGLLKKSPKEIVCVLHLDVRNRLESITHASEGTLTAALVHPREVFSAAILANAASIIVVHNHPSGDANPSKEDIILRERLYQAGELLGIPLLDFVIIGADGSFNSIQGGDDEDKSDGLTREGL